MIDLPRTPSFSLSGKRALVTGASSGIGQGCAVALAEAGAHVICAARGGDKLTETVTAMQAAGYSAEVLQLDQSDLTAVAAAVADLDLDIVVNSAGLARHTPAIDTTP